MEIGIIVAAVVLSVALVLVLILLIWWYCSYRRRKEFSEETRIRSNESLHSGIAKLQVGYETNNHKNAASIRKSFHDLGSKRKVNYYVLQRGISMKSFFSWADHPSLVSEAVEHGWPRFGFNGHNLSSPSARSVLMGLCVTGDQARESSAEVSWEISLESADYMQKVRLNSGMRKGCIDFTPNPLSVSCVTQTALPLPGPFLGNSSFPQEAYFEITTLSSREGDARKERRKEDEKIKLIQEAVNVNTQLDEVKLVINDERKNEAVLVSLGLSVGGSHPRRLPGTYPGSIGFNSNGSVYVDGIKLVFETEKAEWGSTERVIGCGFDPGQKRVFFTVDSELVHVVNCKSDEFSRPLYPTLAANIDITVIVNFGQSPFKYAPANVHRTPNPCFTRSHTNGPGAALGYEDSKELFSMGRIDAEWLNRCTTRSSHSTVNIDNRRPEVDEESEADLFDIVLERMSKSPSTFR
ncbi:hypothetical protein AQUCO_01000623v1 [Aquilegia coerulea]|uniref:B30.2/SPRY domain-containing protein n=1 Tax=Aquilegia coerulea TaxID=218851 RepID=A0A2G5EAU7_AQUCA|nr:hypothetical protein AQUCO_01000623v1 [Aquilegia coerulea]